MFGFFRSPGFRASASWFEIWWGRPGFGVKGSAYRGLGLRFRVLGVGLKGEGGTSTRRLGVGL